MLLMKRLELSARCLIVSQRRVEHFTSTTRKRVNSQYFL
jgi:hypothetical protein